MGNIGTKRRAAAIPEQYTRPNGLYAKCEWDEKVVRKLIVSRKLAPRFPPNTDSKPDLEECPICFMFYPGGLNRSNCCKKPICTECFLQIKKPSSVSVSCPFCNKAKYSVQFLGPKSAEERERELLEEQRVLELQQKARQAELDEDKRRADERKRGAQPTADELQRQLQQSVLMQQDRAYLQHQQSLAPSAFPAPPPPVSSQQRQQRHHRHGHRRHRSSHSSHSVYSQHSQERFERQQLRLQQYFGVQPGFPIAPNVQATSWGSLLTRLATDPSMRHSLVEIEQLMIMEAMRMSMQDAAPAVEAATDPVAVVGVPVLDAAAGPAPAPPPTAQDEMPAPAPAVNEPVEASPAPDDAETSTYTSPFTNSVDLDVADAETANFQETISFSLSVVHDVNANDLAASDGMEEPAPAVAAPTAADTLESSAVVTPLRTPMVVELENLTTPVATAVLTPASETPAVVTAEPDSHITDEQPRTIAAVLEEEMPPVEVRSAVIDDSFAFL